MRKSFVRKHGSTGLQFESPPRYSLWGMQQKPWKKLFLGCLSLSLLMGLLVTAMQLLKNQHELQLLGAQHDRVQQRITDYTSQQQKSEVKTVALTPTQIRAYNAVISQLDMPWQHLFTDLERMTPQDVALIHMELDGQRSTIKLQAEAKTLTSLLTYATNLQQQGIFGRITYSKHETNEQDPNKPVRLSFELTLNRPENLASMETKP